jgi:hypothetical protein
MTKYAVSICATRQKSEHVQDIDHGTVFLLAESDGNAKDLGLIVCLKAFPTKEGYRDHVAQAKSTETPVVDPFGEFVYTRQDAR